MRYTVSAEAASAVVDDGAVILHMRTKRYYSLNETGVAIWSMLEERRPVEDIVASLTARYEIDQGSAATAVAQMLSELVEAELMQMEQT